MPIGERERHASQYYGVGGQREDGLSPNGGPDQDQPEQEGLEDSPEVIVVDEGEVHCCIVSCLSVVGLS